MAKPFCVSLLILLFIVGVLCACTPKTVNHENNALTVAVSIVPLQTFVQAVSGGLVEVVTLIPPGFSPANYAPTPQELADLSKANLYFTLRLPSEEANILPKVKSNFSDLKLIDLVQEVGKVYPHCYFTNCKEAQLVEKIKQASPARDPHLWLSPRRAKVIIDVITAELSQIDAKNSERFRANAADYKAKLDQLDRDIEASLSGLENKAFIIYHPAFGYFADDYGLEMIALEEDGKPVTAQNLMHYIDYVKALGIRVIFYQAEMDSQQARTFAAEINGKAEQITPLAANYIENLSKIACTFKQVMQDHKKDQ